MIDLLLVRSTQSLLATVARPPAETHRTVKTNWHLLLPRVLSEATSCSMSISTLISGIATTLRRALALVTVATLIVQRSAAAQGQGDDGTVDSAASAVTFCRLSDSVR